MMFPSGQSNLRSLDMSKIWQVVCVAVVGLSLSLAVVGCTKTDKMEADKMVTEKMATDKMKSDKMEAATMATDKMATDKMKADKMEKK
jgi:pentapeptide MXKDX repeat protein